MNSGSIFVPRREWMRGIRKLGVWAINTGLVVLLGMGSASAAIPASQRATLKAIYASTFGTGWLHQDGWNGPAGTECTWFGVTCDANATTVTAIDLAGDGLYGVLPPLDGLPDVESLVFHRDALVIPGMRRNILSGPIPPLRGLHRLRVFDGTGFTGAMPSLRGLTQLHEFDCATCSLSGTLDLSGLSGLETFRISGTVHGPLPSLGGLRALREFDVHGDFSGPLPSLAGLAQLHEFTVAGSHFSGGLPDLVDLPQLARFAVSGQVPGPMGRLAGVPQLAEVHLADNLLTGTIPSLDGAPALQVFDVHDNRLAGAVPDLSGLPSLRAFDVAYNALSGALPVPPAGLVQWAHLHLTALCPNRLTPASNPATPTDAGWSNITGVTPWSRDCSPDPRWKTTVRILAPPLLTTRPGEPLTVAAAVYGGANPGGSVTFTSRAAHVADAPVITMCTDVPVVDRVATCTFDALPANPVADYALQASYSGDAANAASRDPAEGAAARVHERVRDVRAGALPTTAALGQAVDLTLRVVAAGLPDAEFDEGPVYTGAAGEKRWCTDVPFHAARSGGFIAHCVVHFDKAGPHVLTFSAGSLVAPPIVVDVVAAQPFDADQFALTGPWYQPSISGQGLELAVYPDHAGAGVATLVGGWFSFDPQQGKQRWFLLQGDLVSGHGDTFDLTVGQGAGGNFDAGPVVAAQAIGTASLRFHDCAHASLDFRLDDGRHGSLALVRLDPPTACSASVPAAPPDAPPENYVDVLHGGGWYQPATSGQGLFIDLVPGRMALMGAWFTYAPSADASDAGVARQRWFTLQDNDYTPGDPELDDVAIVDTEGGIFDQASAVDVRQVGHARIVFHSCTSMTLHYQFDSGELAGRRGSIDEQVLAPVPGCP